MLAAPEPSPDPSLSETDANQTFDALIWALSRPGIPRGLPAAGEARIIRALLDRECRAYSADPLILPEIMRTGAQIAEIDAADHVFLGALQDLAPLDRIALGSDLYPDDGATVVLRGQIGQGPGLRLSGPGIESTLTVQIGGLPSGFWQKRRALIRYPMGFEIFILDGAAVIGIPRSTDIEVL
ncbi:PhnH protein [Candidatus Rhodobacter oscarellae]|uniref:PhnH protein n=1 Tax=Candidatus Rhodobacter oscarellae TaxID=1675527 RepID=A0A0J9E4T0_9RHOB|nr:phosphonate C-P lyase system protein PhnH [Candidatus Rhodobacter lobularis]KMW57756.1 PhnH protein [Candidatus Rhodobacter lobularis]